MAASEPTDKPKSIEFYGGYPVYSESGVDLTLLRGNLRRSLEERWEIGQRALAFALALQGSDQPRRRRALPSDRTTAEASALVKLLAAHHVRYVIVGSPAMYAHGAICGTQDIDICYQRTPANLTALIAAFASIHPYLRGAPPDLLFRFDAPTLTAGVNFLLTTDCGDINLLGEVSGVGDYDQVLAQSVERTAFGLPVRILSVDGLIAAKKASGRTKDQLHLLELIELKKMLDATGETSEGNGGPAAVE